ncbi:HD domain-containing protein [candidate division WOR-3 bacterium]|uniref:HD domain-containing protein n=1 Tax=candidate division WOR-3 bacterium TaxID=2052148 RepID=A0A9D5KAL8_UNCW3|nr:HD domain-containing protein [candidate division WOR-3 bacterium]MBD3365229.1 HD domain-containing protein [candidate division WOR-3 bacterium]
MKQTIRERREELERKIFFHPHATLSNNSKGRLNPEPPDPVRTVFERDGQRILYSLSFRRMRHKTQVFLLPENDHIATRMEHALYVASISMTVARALGLNTDLVNAIALGHDLGHAPFGHEGEKALNEVVKRYGFSFEHELHSLRTVDYLAKLIGKEKAGLNLTFEVRDGIVSHYGETAEPLVEPDTGKDPASLYETRRGRDRPATLEGCIVRVVDRVAYLGRDLEDALRAHLITEDDIPKIVKDTLGTTNGKIIGALVEDMIEGNIKHPKAVGFSDSINKAVRTLYEFNYERVYLNPRVKRYSENAHRILKLLFHRLYEHLDKGKETEDPKPNVFTQLDYFVRYTECEQDAEPAQVVLDFISGMTDNYAVRCFEELYIPKGIR